MGIFRALALALTLAPAVASAQTAKDKQKASELVKEAIAMSQGGNHDIAITLYQDAYEIIPQPLLLSNIGSEYQALDKPVEALKYFCKYIEADPNGSNMSFATAQAKILYIKLGGISDVADKDLCKPIVRKTDSDPADDEDEDDEADDEDETHATPDPTPDPTRPESPPGPKASPLRWVGLGMGVLGGGVFGLGVFYGLKAGKISDDITNHDPNDPWPSNIAQLEADGASHENKQIAFMIGGGVALAAGVVLFFVSAPKQAEQDSAGVSFTPVATPDTLGFAASGRF